MIRISRAKVSVDDALKAVSITKAGGTVLFVGTVRENSGRKKLTHMEMEAAPDLAEKDLERISSAAKRRFGILKVAVTHRTGRMSPGDIILVIAVSAPHRKDAFAACRFIIDELKKTTPIWKKEIGDGLSRWVEGER
jgi:molybdopterin synthase catalytic subunit